MGTCPSKPMKLKEFLEQIDIATQKMTDSEKEHIEVEVQIEYAFDHYTECLGVELKGLRKMTSWGPDGTTFTPYLALCILRN